MIAGLGGGAAAYKQLERLPNDLGQAMEGIANRQQAEAGAKRKENAAQKQAIQKRKDDYADLNKVDPAAFEYEATSHTDFDEIMGKAANQGFKTSTDIRTQANKAFNQGDRETADALHSQADRIETTFKNFKTSRKEFATIMDKNRKDMVAGKILDKSWAMFQDSIDRNEFTMEYQDGDFLIRALKRDKNGDVVRDENGDAEYIEKTMGDVRKGLDQPYQWQDAEGKGGMIDNIMVNFGKKTYDEEQDQYIVTSTEWDETNEAALTNYVESIIGDGKEPLNRREMYKWYENATGEEKFDKFTDKDKSTVEQFIREGVASQFPESVAIKIRGLRVDEKLADSAANRKSREGIAAAGIASRESEGDKNRKAAESEWKAQLKAKAESDANKDKVKAMGKNPEKKMAVVKFMDIAKGLSDKYNEARQKGESFNEDDVAEYYSNQDVPFMIGGNFDWFGLNGVQYNLEGAESTKGVEPQDIFRNVKGMARAAGIELEDTDIKEVLANPEKYRGDSSTKEVDKTDTDPLGLGI